MREHTIKIYKFDELSEDAKKVAIESFRNSNDLHIESEQITEDFEHVLVELGYPETKLEWSLSYSQGDGVAFYGEVDMDIVARKLLSGEMLELYNRIVENDLVINAEITRNSYGYHYSHWNTMSVEMDGDSVEIMMEYLYGDLEEDSAEYSYQYSRIEHLFDELKKKISSDIKNVSRELERQGYQKLEYYNSDEYISEEIEAIDWDFTEDGKVFTY